MKLSSEPSQISTAVLPPLTTPFASEPPQNPSPSTPFIPISKEEYDAVCGPWKLCIIIKVIGKSFAREFLDKELAKIWGWKHQANLIALGKGFYSIKCSSIDEKASILANGPWCIQITMYGFKRGNRVSNHQKLSVTWELCG